MPTTAQMPWTDLAEELIEKSVAAWKRGDAKAAKRYAGLAAVEINVQAARERLGIK